ncbi:hypothetical protein V1460_05945 [Streptomyces sp. SCSIO 30461]|uniref:hypothetical protein n=1 Tax=Streptomyces sp. SCSIO 30461 TaxID=3118085 RepID=UPI0030CEA08D
MDGTVHYVAASDEDEFVRLYDLAADGLLDEKAGYRDWMRSVALAPNAPLLASASGDRAVTIWSATAWQQWGEGYFGRRWADVPFLWAESYFYRKLLAALGYFTPGSWQGVDPFAPFKNTEPCCRSTGSRRTGPSAPENTRNTA